MVFSTPPIGNQFLPNPCQPPQVSDSTKSSIFSGHQYTFVNPERNFHDYDIALAKLFAAHQFVNLRKLPDKNSDNL
jgi:hypothetical protein